MQVSVEDQGAIGRKLTVTIPADEFQASVTKQLNLFRKDAKIAGFRKGKVPQHILEKQFGGSAASQAIDATINATYPKALQEQKIMPAGLLKITPTQVDKGKDFIYEAEIEIYPTIPTPSLSGVEIDRPEVKVAKDDIDRTIENIQKRQTKYNSTDKAAKTSDQIIMDFVGTIDGEAFKGGDAKDAAITLGEGQFLEGFEKPLIGVKTGQKVTAEVAFPKDYAGAEVAGKTAIFEIEVKDVKEADTPVIDDAFAEEMGVEGGIKKLREEVKDGLQRELNTRMRTYVRDQVMASLGKSEDFDLPKALVDEEIQRAMDNVKAQLKQQNMTAPEGVLKPENYQAESANRVKLGLIIREIVESQKIEMTSDAIRERATEMAGNYSEPDAFVDMMMHDDQQRNQIGGVLIEEQVVENLLESADIKTDKKSYEDFMNDTQPAQQPM